jgi:hypothetical protein
VKVGDKVPVTLAGHTVAQATVRELGDGTAVLVVPATQVTMAVRTELDAAPAPVKETETVITGVDRAEGGTAASTETVETTGAAESAVSNDTTGDTTADTADSATTVETTEVAPAAETPVVEAPAVEAPVDAPVVQNDTQS